MRVWGRVEVTMEKRCLWRRRHRYFVARRARHHRFRDADRERKDKLGCCRGRYTIKIDDIEKFSACNLRNLVGLRFWLNKSFAAFETGLNTRNPRIRS